MIATLILYNIIYLKQIIITIASIRTIIEIIRIIYIQYNVLIYIRWLKTFIFKIAFASTNIFEYINVSIIIWHVYLLTATFCANLNNLHKDDKLSEIVHTFLKIY